jgi:hypothetical protein
MSGGSCRDWRTPRATAALPSQGAGHIVAGDRPPWLWPSGATHVADRVVVDDPFVIGPSDRDAQHPEPAHDHRRCRPGGFPPGERLADPLRCQRQHPIPSQRPRVRRVPDPRRGPPRMIRLRPTAQQLPHRQHRRRPSNRPTSRVLRRQLRPIYLRIGRGAIEGHRPLQRPPGHHVRSSGHTDLPHPRPTLTQRTQPTTSSHTNRR